MRETAWDWQFDFHHAMKIETSRLDFLPCPVLLWLWSGRLTLFSLSSDHERVALGNEEGLFVIHVTKDGKIHSLRSVLCYLFCVTYFIFHWAALNMLALMN